MKLRQEWSRRAWDAQRFGITPRGAIDRLRPPQRAARVVSISVPKAGTHLVERILCLHPDYHRRLTRTLVDRDTSQLQQHFSRLKNGEILCGHIFYSAECDRKLHDASAQSLFTIRDPRDVIVSNAHYAHDQTTHYRHAAFKSLPNIEDRIALLIEGDESGLVPPISTVLKRYRGWLNSDALTIRFEDLVDPASRDRTLRSIFDHLGTPLSSTQSQRISARAVSPISTTFRRGQAGAWREVFNRELAERFNRAAGDLLEEFGYS